LFKKNDFFKYYILSCIDYKKRFGKIYFFDLKRYRKLKKIELKKATIKILIFVYKKNKREEEERI